MNNPFIIKNSLSTIKNLKTYFNSKFSITKLLKKNIIIYLKTKYTHIQKNIFLTQKNYTKKILKNYNIKNYQPTTTPINIKYKLITNIKKKKYNSTFYNNLINSLLHLPITKFNIKFSIKI